MNPARQNWRTPNRVSSTNYEPLRRTHLEDEIYAQQHLTNFHERNNLISLYELAEQIKLSKDNNRPIILSGSGTSYHNALMTKNALLREEIPAFCMASNDLKQWTFLDNSLIIAFSQSGETADLLAPLQQLREQKPYNSQTETGTYIASIVNVENSSIDYLSDLSVHTKAGPELSVASTKAHTRAFYAIHQLEQILSKGEISLSSAIRIKDIFNKTIDENIQTLEEIVNMFHSAKDFFFMGTNSQDVLALESALKLKELAYIHAEGYNVADFKHGPLALIEENTPVVLIDIQNEAIHNAREIQSRGGYIIGVSNGLKETIDQSNPNSIYDKFLRVPEKGFVGEYMALVLMQLMSLKITEKIGNNVDKPRNLAKSVTVK